VDLYIHSPIRLHGVELNWLSIGTNLVYFTSSSVDKVQVKFVGLISVCSVTMTQQTFIKFIFVPVRPVLLLLKNCEAVNEGVMMMMLIMMMMFQY
jgi:hypothetical protein